MEEDEKAASSRFKVDVPSFDILLKD